MGFSDYRIGELTKKSENQIIKIRDKFKIKPKFFKVDTCAAEFSTKTSYLYSSYEIPYKVVSWKKKMKFQKEKKLLF